MPPGLEPAVLAALAGPAGLEPNDPRGPGTEQPAPARGARQFRGGLCPTRSGCGRLWPVPVVGEEVVPAAVAMQGGEGQEGLVAGQ